MCQLQTVLKKKKETAQKSRKTTKNTKKNRNKRCLSSKGGLFLKRRWILAASLRISSCSWYAKNRNWKNELVTFFKARLKIGIILGPISSFLKLLASLSIKKWQKRNQMKSKTLLASLILKRDSEAFLTLYKVTKILRLPSNNRNPKRWQLLPSSHFQKKWTRKINLRIRWRDTQCLKTLQRWYWIWNSKLMRGSVTWKAVTSCFNFIA